MTDALCIKLLAMLDDSAALVALFDQYDMLRYANTAFRQSFFLTQEECLSWAELMRRNYLQKQGSRIETDDIETWLRSACSRRGKLPYRAFEADLCDGRWMWMTETMSADGWMLCQASDITELRADKRELRQARDVALRAAQTDPMTGISNRTHLMQLLQLLLQQRREHSAPVCLAILDLDHFKRINDLEGHPAGDQVICGFVQTVRAQLRQRDGFGRLGGEEFMLLLPQTSLLEAEQCCERILAAARRDRPLAAKPELGYTCSIGLTELRPDDDIASCYARADEALYHAKGSGRDCLSSSR
ncbi:MULTISPECIES: GGDEF domain-containing protein [Chromobacterium]|uniref:GGDEF domain-containing protein n=1 Tax=Chromobacterium TaxID=535 RepID=UPI000593CA71|nr:MULTISPECIES: GGDEF domain-containing protein [Chromobacterium]MDH0340999.1 GGDEF domain-containing protein [Chromobacterium haemolyticum]